MQGGCSQAVIRTDADGHVGNLTLKNWRYRYIPDLNVSWLPSTIITTSVTGGLSSMIGIERSIWPRQFCSQEIIAPDIVCGDRVGQRDQGCVISDQIVKRYRAECFVTEQFINYRRLLRVVISGTRMPHEEVTNTAQLF